MNNKLIDFCDNIIRGNEYRVLDYTIYDNTPDDLSFLKYVTIESPHRALTLFYNKANNLMSVTGYDISPQTYWDQIYHCDNHDVILTELNWLFDILLEGIENPNSPQLLNRFFQL